jgi:hypothetical protein
LASTQLRRHSYPALMAKRETLTSALAGESFPLRTHNPVGYVGPIQFDFVS